jgi:hypothetical protein
MKELKLESRVEIVEKPVLQLYSIDEMMPTSCQGSADQRSALDKVAGGGIWLPSANVYGWIKVGVPTTFACIIINDRSLKFT